MCTHELLPPAYTQMRCGWRAMPPQVLDLMKSCNKKYTLSPPVHAWYYHTNSSGRYCIIDIVFSSLCFTISSGLGPCQILFPNKYCVSFPSIREALAFDERRCSVQSLNIILEQIFYRFKKCVTHVFVMWLHPPQLLAGLSGHHVSDAIFLPFISQPHLIVPLHLVVHLKKLNKQENCDFDSFFPFQPSIHFNYIGDISPHSKWGDLPQKLYRQVQFTLFFV